MADVGADYDFLGRKTREFADAGERGHFQQEGRTGERRNAALQDVRFI
jgi:hypothetical protein